MKRINYLVAPGERLFGGAFAGLAAPRVRLAVACIGGALAVLALPAWVESARLHDLERAGAAYEARLDETAIDAARVRRLERDVTRLRALDDGLTSVRRSGDASADEIVTLGNALPDDAWLTTLRRDGDGLDVEGAGDRMRTIAAALAALARLPRYATARLVSAYGAAGGTKVSYSIVLERRR
ncbi:MAG TPA: PilN domain-containing protein [Candidatus Elarobacter sp.]|jgi:Tfp pilus assembly protein PilN|nr:PilN domain-containing protein [Candidatus Elarobacter sp.]